MRTALGPIAEHLPFRATPDGALLRLLEHDHKGVLRRLCLDALAEPKTQTTAFYAVPLLRALAWAATVSRVGVGATGVEEVLLALRAELDRASEAGAVVEAEVSGVVISTEVEAFVVVCNEGRRRVLGVVRVPWPEGEAA